MFIRTVNKCQTHTKSTLWRVVTWSHPSLELEAPAPTAKASRLLGLAAGLVGAEKALCGKGKALEGRKVPTCTKVLGQQPCAQHLHTVSLLGVSRPHTSPGLGDCIQAQPSQLSLSLEPPQRPELIIAAPTSEPSQTREFPSVSSLFLTKPTR